MPGVIDSFNEDIEITGCARSLGSSLVFRLCSTNDSVCLSRDVATVTETVVASFPSTEAIAANVATNTNTADHSTAQRWSLPVLTSPYFVDDYRIVREERASTTLMQKQGQIDDAITTVS